MKRKAKIYYTSLDDFWRKEEKLGWLRDNPIEKIAFESITPDEKHNWINQTDNDFEILLPLIDKENKYGGNMNAIFELYSNGVSTNRDEWVYDNDKNNLEAKAKFLSNSFNKSVKRNLLNEEIKWSRDLKNELTRRKTSVYSKDNFTITNYRPFYKLHHFTEKLFNDILTKNHYQMFGSNFEKNNLVITFSGVNHSKSFQTLAVNSLFGLDFLEKTQSLPLYTYSENQKHENITDWGLTQFQTNYKDLKTITKQDIFYYTYSVLHSPHYRRKYEQNLKREFPRLPFYAGFTQWRDWGEQLMDLHINYETQEPFPLERKDLDLGAKQKTKQDNLFAGKAKTEDETFTAKPKTKLRADKTNGTIEIDSHTILTGVPPSAWEYKLGNRSALEWILDQYKEKKPSDATIAERFNTYKFEDYKEQTIDLLKRVCNVSVKTMEIVNQMPNAD
jgi:predicted helicase